MAALLVLPLALLAMLLASGPGAARGSRDDDPDTHRDTGDDPGEDEPDERTAAEWVTLTVSVLVVGVLIGAAIYEHFARDEPAGVRVTVQLDLERADERDGLTYIPWVAENTGRDPAEAVVILFEITLGGETVQESTAEIPFLANGGMAEGELVTDLALATHTISAHVVTLQLP